MWLFLDSMKFLKENLALLDVNLFSAVVSIFGFLKFENWENPLSTFLAGLHAKEETAVLGSALHVLLTVSQNEERH